MKSHRIRSLASRTACLAVLALAAATPVHAQQAAPAAKKAPAAPETQVLAREILMRMAAYLGGAKGYSVSLRAGYDAVQKSGQKIEFNESRKITLARPDRLRVEGERSDGAKTQVVFNGKEIILVDGASNVYATAPQPGSIDHSVVHFVRDLGMRLPLAMLLLTRMPSELEARVKTVDYRGEGDHFRHRRPSPCRAHRHGGFPGLGGRRRPAAAAARGDHVQESSRPAAVLGAVFRLEHGAGGE